MRIHWLAFVAAVAMTSHLSAQTATPPASSAPPSDTVNMDLAVTDAIRAVLAESFDEGYIAMLQALGHQQAVAATCSNFTIDPQAFSNEFDLIYDDAAGKPRSFKAGQRRELEHKATLALGMAFGAQIAISANDHPAFCQAAEQERTGGKVGHLVWAK